MEKNLADVFTDVKKDVTTYLDLRLKLLKLETYEKTGKIAAVMSFVFVILFIVFFAVLFLFLGLGYHLGNLLDNQALGMTLIGSIYLLILIIAILFRKSFMSKIFSLFIAELTADDDGKEQA